MHYKKYIAGGGGGGGGGEEDDGDMMKQGGAGPPMLCSGGLSTLGLLSVHPSIAAVHSHHPCEWLLSVKGTACQTSHPPKSLDHYTGGTFVPPSVRGVLHARLHPPKSLDHYTGGTLYLPP